MKDELTVIEYDGHSWEVGYFGEKNNGFSAYGFRQDDIIIRVTSEYEARIFEQLLRIAKEQS